MTKDILFKIYNDGFAWEASEEKYERIMQSKKIEKRKLITHVHSWSAFSVTFCALKQFLSFSENIKP